MLAPVEMRNTGQRAQSAGRRCRFMWKVLTIVSIAGMTKVMRLR